MACFEHRGKGEIMQNREAELWNSLGSNVSFAMPIKVLKHT
jgi:hypothetical protein